MEGGIYLTIKDYMCLHWLEPEKYPSAAKSHLVIRERIAKEKKYLTIREYCQYTQDSFDDVWLFLRENSGRCRGIYLTVKEYMNLHGIEGDKYRSAAGSHRAIRDAIAKNKRYLTIREYCEYTKDSFEEVWRFLRPGQEPY